MGSKSNARSMNSVHEYQKAEQKKQDALSDFTNPSLIKWNKSEIKRYRNKYKEEVNRTVYCGGVGLYYSDYRKQNNLNPKFMKIKRNSIAIRYYNYVFDNVPMDFCSLFWGLFYAVPFFFLELPGRWLCKRLDGKYIVFLSGLYFWYLVLLLFQIIRLLITLFNLDWFNIDWTLLLTVLLVCLIIGVSVGVVVALVVFLSIVVKEKIIDKLRTQDNTAKKEPSKLSVWVGAIRQKHCTKLEYV